MEAESLTLTIRLVPSKAGTPGSQSRVVVVAVVEVH
jgi:hypothetical protein